MAKKLYCGGSFDFDYTKPDYKSKASKDYRVISVLKDLDTFLRGRKIVSLSQNLDYIGPFYCETDNMQGDEIVDTELRMIKESTDCIFVLDRANCPGTVTECIYAATLKKNIHIFYLQTNEQEETESDLHTYCWFTILSTLNINPENTQTYCVNKKEDFYTQITSLIEKLK